MDTTLTRQGSSSGERTLLVTCAGVTTEHALPAEGVLHVGRGADCEIRVDHPTLSRRHLRLVVGRSLSVEDLASRNGTRVSGRVLDPGAAVLVAPGTPIEAGDAVLYVRPSQHDDEADPIERLLGGRAHVVIRGEPGAGKSHLAERFRHAAPERTVVVEGPGTLPSVAPGTRLIVTTTTEFALEGAVPIAIPPLRARLNELPVLVDALVAEIAAANGRPAPLVSADALSAIAEQSWPGNLRELADVLTRAVMLRAGNRVLTRTHLALDPAERAAGAGEGSLSSAVSEAEHRRILEALRQTDGNQTRAAKLLGISRGTLLSRLERYGVPRPRK